MAPVHSIQPTFAGGEFAPSLYSRVDIAKYATGLKRARNFFVHPHGGASNRPGTYYVRTTKYPTKKSRVVAFEFSTTQSYSIEFGEYYARFHTHSGTVLETAKTITGATQANPVVITSNAHGFSNGDQVVISGVVGMTRLNGRQFTVAGVTANTFQLSGVDGTAFSAYVSGGSVSRIYQVVTPYAESDLANLKFTQSADVLYIVHPSYAPRTLSRFADSPPDWRLATFSFSGGPFMVSNTTASATMQLASVSGTGVALTSSTDVFDAKMIGGLFRLKHVMAGEAASTAFSATGTTSSINCGGTWRLITHGTWTGTLKIEKSEDGGGTWTLLRQFTSANDFNPNTSGTDDGPFLVRLNMSAYTSGTCNADLTTDPYEHTGIVKITAVADTKHATVDVVTRAGQTTATFDWAEGSWSDYNGWPSSVVFFQDRLGFSATNSEPQTFWTSKTGEYTDFGRSDPLVDSDGLSVNLPSRKLNGIRNLIGLQQIVAITSATDWTISSADGGALTPTSIGTKLQGYRGSSGVDPCVIGNRIIYVQPMGSVVRDMGFDYASQSFTGDNLSIFANHLFTGYTITELAYQQEPDSLVWAVRSDGKLLSCTYVKEQEVLAWCWHETSGLVESICTIPSNGYDELWLVVNRNGSRFVERMPQRMTTTATRDQFFVDAGLSYNVPITITGITNANPVVVTAPSHGFSNGDLVDITDVVGLMATVDGVSESQISNARFKVMSAATNTFQLGDEVTGDPIDGSTYTAYLPANSPLNPTGLGGYVRKVVSAVSGLDHLEGQTVAILANGNVHPQQTVVGGSITLTAPASVIHAGLPYTCDLQTLPVEVKLQDGTIQDRKVHIPVVTLKFLNSGGGYMGTEETQLDEIVQRTAEPLGQPVALYSGDFGQSVAGGFEIGASVFVRQVDPLPMTILSVTPRVEIGG